MRQSEPRGLGHAVLLAEEFVAGEPFAVALGDSIVWNGGGKSLMRQLVQTHAETGAAATIAVEEVTAQDVVNYGIVKPVDKVGHVFRISDLVEKPSVEDAPSRLAIAARYIFGPQVFQRAARHGTSLAARSSLRCHPHPALGRLSRLVREAGGRVPAL